MTERVKYRCQACGEKFGVDRVVVKKTLDRSNVPYVDWVFKCPACGREVNDGQLLIKLIGDYSDYVNNLK